MKKVIIAAIISGLALPIQSFSDDGKSDLLKAIENRPHCDPAAVSALLAKTKADEDILYSLAINNCMDDSVIGPTLQVVGGPGVLHVEDRILNHANSETIPAIKAANKNGSVFDSEESLRIGAALGFCETISKSSCDTKNGSQVSKDLCARLSKAKDRSKEINALLAKSSKASRPSDEDFSAMCPVHFDLLFNQHMMDKEKETGRESGFVDASKMHELGSEVAGAKRQLKPYEEAYKKNSGHNFDYSKCPAKFDRWQGAWN